MPASPETIAIRPPPLARASLKSASSRRSSRSRPTHWLAERASAGGGAIEASFGVVSRNPPTGGFYNKGPQLIEQRMRHAIAHLNR
jgi:hypothetical protein